jgi:hypothetical protein
MADDQQPGLSPQDRDAMIRTVLTEADSNDPAGWAAVASTIRNRLATGKFGDSPAAIVTAPGQFEVWANGRAQAVTPNHPNYEAAGRIVDAVASGLPDITGGATHFYSPSGQTALGRQAPAWGKQPLTAVGGNTFFAPHGKVTFQDAPASKAIETATSEKPVADPSDDDFLKQWGVDPKKVNPAATSSPQAGPALSKDDEAFLKQWGVDPAKTQQSAPASQKSGFAAIPPGDTAAAIGSGIGDLPIVGPYVKERMIRGAAAIGSVVNPALGLPAPSADDIRQWDAQLKQEHPYGYSGGRVLGAVAAAAPVGATAVGGRLLGMTGNMIPRMLYGGASAGTLGAADAYTHGDNPLVGGVTGVVGGTGAPVLGGMIGAGVNALTNTAQKYLMPTSVSGVSRPAAQIASQVVGMEDPAAIRSTFKQLGPLGMLAEAGPSTTGLAGALALKPSEAKTVVTNAINARAAGRDARLATDINAAVGPDPIPSQVEAGLKASRKALSPEYEQAFANAKAVDTEPLANRLDASVANLRGPEAASVKEVRSDLNIPGTDQLDPHPRALFATREAIDGKLSTETNSKVIRQLTMARQEVDNELQKAVPGIKAVDAKWQELKRQSEGLKTGDTVLDSGKSALRPSEFAQTFNEAANPAGTFTGPSATPLRIQQGIAGDIHRLVGTKSNDLVALKNILQGEGGWNTAKLTEAFGPENTNRLLGGVAREGAFDATTNELVKNSATARRQAAGELLKDSEPGSLNLLPASVAGAAMQTGKKVLFDPLVQLLTANPSAPRNLELAHMMVAQGATRDQILEQLLRLNARQQSVSNTGNLLAGVLGGGANRLISGAAVTNRP